MNAMPPATPKPKSPAVKPAAPSPLSQRPLPHLKDEEVNPAGGILTDEFNQTWEVVSFRVNGKMVTGRIQTDSGTGIVHIVKKDGVISGFWHEEGRYSFFVNASGEIVEGVQSLNGEAVDQTGRTLGSISDKDLFLLIKETDSQKIIAVVELKE